MNNINGWMDALNHSYKLYCEEKPDVNYSEFMGVLKKTKIDEENKIYIISDDENIEIVKYILKYRKFPPLLLAEKEKLLLIKVSEKV